MNNIKILIKAYGCIGDDYEGKEIIKEKLIEKDSTQVDLTENDLKQVLKYLINAVKEIKTLYPDQQTKVIFHHDNRVESLKFEITYATKDQGINVLEEKAFFDLVALHPKLSDLILAYCDITDDGEEGTRIIIDSEYGDAPPAGTYAMLALVEQNKKWIHHYIKFLRTNNLDHEVEQMWHIRAIVEKYDWCTETTRLAIARNVSCCGQGGSEQFNQLLANGLSDYLNQDVNKLQFLKDIKQEFIDYESTSRGISLLKGNKDYYIKYRTPKVNAFAQVLSEQELIWLTEEVTSRWDIFHKLVE
ncbi:hypothetical protein [Psychromonas algicola]|uniref:hypothetical protein n=1 Tax=Psychromonas algicola TaxID=2555642 RepID=UPI001067A603|nr:hypothetical protein [Psychromonas sp. RZ5]TEW50224.1 hypothetical protein E2R67_09435 [Psychromonas sp. RZ5]